MQKALRARSSIWWLYMLRKCCGSTCESGSADQRGVERWLEWVCASLSAFTEQRIVLYAMSAAPSKSVLVAIANSSEEIEAVVAIDVLRRAGARVVVASVEDGREVTCSRGVVLVADKLIGECADELFDAIVLPGGMPGAERLRDSVALTELLKKQGHRENAWTAAICAAPAVVLASQGMLDGKRATCHPNFVSKLPDQSEAEGRVVIDGLTLTSRGPGTAFEFALQLVEKLFGREKMQQVAAPMVVHSSVIAQ